MACNDSRRLDGKTALVTGTGGGIGGQIAIRLMQAGAAVALHYRQSKPTKTIDQVESDFRSDSVYCTIKADFGVGNFAQKLLDEVESHIGEPDILVNCAASQEVSRLVGMSDLEFDNMIQTNVSALFSLSNAFAKRQSQSKTNDASIINISSIEAIRPAIGHGHYATSKAAVEALTKSLALEYGPSGLRVNAIAPGLIEREGIEADWPEGVQSWKNHCPLKRMGTPDDVAQAVLFLASPASKFISGTVLTIDGGMSVTPGW